MIRTHLDKIASVTRNLRLGRQVTLTEGIEARPGAVVVGRIHGRRTFTINSKTFTGG